MFLQKGIILIALLISPMGRKTIQELAEKIHKDYLASFRHAKVWGASVDFRGQQLGLEHVLTDSDIAEIAINRQG
jgi:ribosome-interacting GTPase 1